MGLAYRLGRRRFLPFYFCLLSFNLGEKGSNFLDFLYGLLIPFPGYTKLLGLLGRYVQDGEAVLVLV